MLKLENISLTFNPGTVNEKKALTDLSLYLQKGDFVTILGSNGAGKSTLFNTIAGTYLPDSGSIILDGKELHIHSPQQAIDEQIALLTEDRRANGIIAQMSVEENITVPIWKRVAKRGFVDRKREIEIANKSIKELLIKCHSSKMRVDNLSGGNQQKCVLAKWLNTEPKLLMLDEPTRGVDIGAKVEIYQIMNRLVEQGMSILWVSSELPELIEISDRILVLCKGQIVGEFNHGEADQNTVLALASGATAN